MFSALIGFEYTVADAVGLFYDRPGSVFVASVNDAPTAGAVVLAVLEDQANLHRHRWCFS
jgi:hypothetical protein